MSRRLYKSPAIRPGPLCLHPRGEASLQNLASSHSGSQVGVLPADVASFDAAYVPLLPKESVLSLEYTKGFPLVFPINVEIYAHDVTLCSHKPVLSVSTLDKAERYSNACSLLVNCGRYVSTILGKRRIAQILRWRGCYINQGRSAQNGVPFFRTRPQVSDVNP